MNLLVKLSIGLVPALALFYQVFLKSLFFVTFGYGREMQPIADIASYSCRRVEDPQLAACEDMWLSETTRTLFLACSDPAARRRWMPNIGKLNATGRSTTDSIIAMKIDAARGDSFEYSKMKLAGFPGTTGEGQIHLVGLTGKDIPSLSESNDEISQDVQLLVVNAKPSIDPQTGALLDNERVGANMTIELFTTDRSVQVLKHQVTYHSPHIRTPNNVAYAYGQGFYFTNDHGTAKTGWRFHAAPVLGNGDVTYCGGEENRSCKTVSDGLRFPNGLLMGMDGQLYVPSAFSGGITVYKPDAQHNLTKVDFIDIPYPLDNLSQDRNGDLWVAGIPKLGELTELFEDPYGKQASPTTIFRIRKRARGEWEIMKALEDRDAEILPGATTAVHDVKTGRVFVSGVASPFISVCEAKK